MMYRRAAIAQIVLLALVMTSSLGFACERKSAVRRAIEASYRLPATTNDVIKQVREGRDRGIISTDQAAKFGEALNKMAAAELAYIDAVKIIKAAVEKGQTPDRSAMANLQFIFDSQIVGPFLDVLSLARLISGSQADLILLAVEAARLLLRTIGGGIGSQAVKVAAMVAKVV